ncbi:hypothetical protein O6H91_13G017100 [Diphasiastrum complanatum]|uniref:Uncharacterized protein n=1 Tax=Diphasiastrum complanatum TaxID=34168 RepID=A0ACC2BSW2_DIPCM|nr:hypothetical protein O6H91_13G017100 [Diphasiastrum complanatum]
MTRPTESMFINMRQQIIIWWAGLIRGAVSIALAFNQFAEPGASKSSEHATIVSSTIMVVIFSTTVFGIMTKPLINFILPSQLQYVSDLSEPATPQVMGLDPTLQLSLLSNEEQNNNSPTKMMKKASRLSLFIHAQRTTIHRLWRKFDNAYMRPMFGSRGFVPTLPTAIENEDNGMY